jgi:septal ring factor EnvC (AmiA/AmiB activator)
LEFNRIALLEKINQSGFIWAQQQGVIREYGQEIQNLEKRIEGFKSSNSTLEGDYKDLQAANEKMVTEIDALETHIKQLESKPVLEVERKLARFFGRIKCWLWKTEK